MSELVNLVAIAVHKSDSGTDPAHDPTLCDECLDNARAAIKAVAEWLMSDKHYQTDNWAGKLLLAELEDRK